MADKSSRRKRITQQRREQILKAGMEVFLRKGFAAATVPEIARAAGVAAGTIYLYYPSKRELFVAVIRGIIINAPLLELIDKMPGADDAIVFRQIMQNRFDLIQSEEMSRMPALMGEILRDPDLKAIWLEQFLRPLTTKMEAVYGAMAACGKIRRGEPSVTVRVVGGLILGFLILRIMEGENSPLEKLPQEKVFAEMADFILYGLTGNGTQDKQQEVPR